MRSLALIFAFCGVSSVYATCSSGLHNSPYGPASAADPDNYHKKCIDGLRGQIRKEFSASMQYLIMGAYFAQDDVNLPGVSKMFFDHADEERQHGIKFLEYLRMRGDTQDSGIVGDEVLKPVLKKYEWTNMEEALRDALKMEKYVTGAVKGLIDTCDNDNTQDYHSADWLTGTWLEEQLQGQRHLSGMINTLSGFRRDHEELADWMFDKQILAEA